MPQVTINDREMEALLGERLLSVARRNGAHIGFVCDGRGVCTTCRCRVLAGAEQLSPPSEAERAWFTERRLLEGHRLACQTAIRGPGPIRVLTNAEELRRNTIAALRNDPDIAPRDAIEPLADQLARLNADQLARFPTNIIAALARVGPWRFTYPVRDEERYLDDSARVIRRMLDGPPPAGRRTAAGLAEVPVGTPDPAYRYRTAVGLEEVAVEAPPPPPASPLEQEILAAARALRRANDDLRRRRR